MALIASRSRGKYFRNEELGMRNEETKKDTPSAFRFSDTELYTMNSRLPERQGFVERKEMQLLEGRSKNETCMQRCYFCGNKIITNDSDSLYGRMNLGSDTFLHRRGGFPARNMLNTVKTSSEFDGNTSCSLFYTPETSEDKKAYLETSDAEYNIYEQDDKLASLKSLILQAKIEAKNIAKEQAEAAFEADKKAMEGKETMRKRGRRIVRGDKTVRQRKERFSEFENSIFLYKFKNRVKRYSCPYEGCSMELPTLSRIKRHYIIHTKLRPFECMNKSCNKKFSRKDNMLQHYKVHCNYRKLYKIKQSQSVSNVKKLPL